MYGIFWLKFHHKESLYITFPKCSPVFKGQLAACRVNNVLLKC